MAKAIAEVVQQHGGVMTTEDLASHVTTFEDPISADYKGYRVWEVPPNGQGITTLMALNILEGMDLKGGLCQFAYHHFTLLCMDSEYSDMCIMVQSLLFVQEKCFIDKWIV